METAYYRILLHCFAEGTVSKNEMEELFEFGRRNEEAFDGLLAEAELADVMGERTEHGQVAESITIRVRERLLDSIHESYQTKAVHRVHFLKTAWFRYAAVLLLIAGTATYFYKHNEGPQKDIVQQPTTISPDGSAVIGPGGNKAILTLSDGSTIVLDSASNGALADQGTTKVIKLTNGSLAYQAKPATEAIGFNTISTPNGGQYQIVLPDGSRAWLNAASSIRFPTAFAAERTVTITGEVYFEIAKDRIKPFFVQAGAERIEILGTSLNVNAYSNEPAVITTLLEGSIQIGKLILKPGEAYANGKKYITKTDQAIAWKNGFFNFQDANLRQVMRQLERWYDIEVIVPAGIPNKDFYGEMSRGLTLQEVLKAIQGTGVHFSMEGRKLILQP